MKLTNLAKMAMIGAVALGFAMSGQEAKAQCAVTQAVTFDAQVPETMDICATIDNQFDTTVTDVDFETIGATSNVGEYGCLIMDAVAAGTIDEDNTAVGCSDTDGIARLVSDDEAGTPGLIAISGAFPNQEVRLQFIMGTAAGDEELTCQGTSPPLLIGRLFTDQATTVAEWNLDDGADNTARNAAAVIGAADTDVSGDLDIYIGAELRTDETSGAPYESGACAGDFDVTLFY
ncbi:MAG: hypothetical protein ACK4NR_00260 [Micavibrio sp.]